MFLKVKKNSSRHSVVSDIKGNKGMRLTPVRNLFCIVFSNVSSLFEGLVAPFSKIFATLSLRVEKENEIMVPRLRVCFKSEGNIAVLSICSSISKSL